ncbi:hypothetical protein JI435_415040 [Parastagonospora nodorum SN15]|uniref:Uncharacterized protein n=1 Tax=Phaeosphaeria nodorum (strain SN15 / ATCC MYA-4574 / FGSC 10173) TaxID=321614 RepID=A0A7U2I5P6_PHANO|nr:hypothetical protein JI435_415040 [Parastagonospora nodorum SN15]
MLHPLLDILSRNDGYNLPRTSPHTGFLQPRSIFHLTVLDRNVKACESYSGTGNLGLKSFCDA